jgi:hypothetical protein
MSLLFSLCATSLPFRRINFKNIETLLVPLDGLQICFELRLEPQFSRMVF